MPIIKKESAGKEADLLIIYHIPAVAPNILWDAVWNYATNNMVRKLLTSLQTKLKIVLDSQHHERPTNELPKMRI